MPVPDTVDQLRQNPEAKKQWHPKRKAAGGSGGGGPAKKQGRPEGERDGQGEQGKRIKPPGREHGRIGRQQQKPAQQEQAPVRAAQTAQAEEQQQQRPPVKRGEAPGQAGEITQDVAGGTPGQRPGLRVVEVVDHVGLVDIGAQTAPPQAEQQQAESGAGSDRKSTRLNSSHQIISYAVFCLKKKKTTTNSHTH